MTSGRKGSSRPSTAEKIAVAIRMRPLAQDEIASGTVRCVFKCEI